MNQCSSKTEDMKSIGTHETYPQNQIVQSLTWTNNGLWDFYTDAASHLPLQSPLSRPMKAHRFRVKLMRPSIVKEYGYLFEFAFHPRSIRVPSAFHPRSIWEPKLSRPRAPNVCSAKFVFSGGTRMVRGWNKDLTFEGPMSYTVSMPVCPRLWPHVWGFHGPPLKDCITCCRRQLKLFS